MSRLQPPMAVADDKDELVAEYNTGRYYDTVSAYVRPSYHPGKWCMWCARGSTLMTIDSWYATRSAAVAHAREFVEARRREAVAQSAPTDDERPTDVHRNPSNRRAPEHGTQRAS